MAIEILMPALSPTMKEGNLAKWLKKEGDSVESGEVIAEIETDKAIMEVEAVDDGILAKIVVSEGTKNVKVNDLIAIIAEEGEDKDAAIAEIESKKPQTQEPTKKDEVAEQPTEEKSANIAVEENSGDKRIFASPLARRIAAQEKIDISKVEGSGPRGRIVKYDIESFLSQGNSSSVSQTYVPQADKEVPISGMRQVIADRLVESKQQVPHFYLDVECVVDKLLDFRKDINSSAPLDENGKPEFKISINDMLIKASALALNKNPKVNSAWYGDKIIQFGSVDISVAVAIEDGLMTPIVKNADRKNMIQISREVKELVKKAQSQRLKPEEYQGGSFSISNLGMYSIKSFYAIINPPQSCILSIGNTRETPMFDKNGNIVKKQVMNVSLSCDHRVVDGATGSIFLNTLKEFIENPSLMICY
ncbi:pyruvate dehydrogenase complex dihydrolipoamide acetyltransferase [Rickettsiales endosymbiont of Trichoplax sp. H2]|uniref:pyruvate dehydrogenase complex dihydrolipoamide acetyltransferase n=1 Tax=Rickettsiales endosymbiont of Trichoplax sp. H2 TaxID=2021221 RepID=UPI0012B24E12|nr:pyruvate dehydrogenase complex dihydrolipoamide acetyltransferase [Rickettsiales endosymbiont of Trichoplax sp. H2]MSO13879.1 Dihydrolipoyllysine-residue acetyltransferase component of pyruvate dehydrogenase complex [Rickettsiales endosymbiont of Trichoplax sp. H2]